MPSTLIRGARVLDVRVGKLESKDILIEDARIRKLQPNIAAEPGCNVIEADGKVAIPGLINAHTHAHNNLLKGIGDNWTLEDMRNHAVSLNANRTVQDQYLSAALGAIEMLKTGCTSAYDQFISLPAPTPETIDAVVMAYADSGMRAVLAPAVSDMVFYQAIPGLLATLPDAVRKSIEAIQPAACEKLLGITRYAIRRWDGHAQGRIRIATAPVIPGECTDELMAGCLEITREYGVGMHTHLAETKIQAMNGYKRWGMSVVNRLACAGVLGPHFVGGHGVWVDDNDIQVLAGHGATLAHNPASNLKLGSGIAPVREFLDAGIVVGLGSDGSMSSDNQNMFEAMRFASLVSNVRFGHQPERWLGSHEVLRMCTLGGARLLGLAHDLGAIEVGRLADIVLLDTQSIFLTPLNNAVNALVYCETAGSVHSVFVGGSLVVSQGEILTLDEDRIKADAREAVSRLLTAQAPDTDRSRSIQPFLRAACAACAAQRFHIQRYA